MLFRSILHIKSAEIIAGKTKTSDEVEEMLEGGDPAIFTSDVSTEKGTYWISDYRLVRLLPCLVETNCSTFSDSRFKLIGNR